MSSFLFLVITSLGGLWDQPPDATYEWRLRLREDMHWISRETYEYREFSPVRNQTEPARVVQDLRFKVVSVDDQGAVTLEVTVISVENTTNLVNPFSYDALRGIPITMELNANGAVVAVRRPENLPETARRTFDRFRQIFLNHDYGMYAPPQPVAVGETWEGERVFGFELDFGIYDHFVTFKGTLAELRRMNQNAYPLVTFEGDFSGSLNEGRAGIFKGSIKGEELVDLASGLYLRMEAELTQEITQPSPLGEIRAKVNIRMVRERLDADVSL